MDKILNNFSELLIRIVKLLINSRNMQIVNLVKHKMIFCWIENGLTKYKHKANLL